MKKKFKFQIIQNWSRDTFHSSLIETDNKSLYLFNTSDGMQRDLINKYNINQIKHIFLSGNKKDMIYSYLGMLYLQDKQAKNQVDFNIFINNKVYLWGPQSTRDFFKFRLFPNQILRKVNEYNIKSGVFISEEFKYNNKMIFEDENLRVYPFCVEYNNEISMSYLIEKKDKTINSPNNTTDCNILILYFPTIYHAEKLISNNYFSETLHKFKEKIKIVVHIFSDKNFLNEIFFQNFLTNSFFNSTKHIFDCPDYNTYFMKNLSKHKMKILLNKCDKNLFSLGDFQEVDTLPKCILSESIQGNFKKLDIIDSKIGWNYNFIEDKFHSSSIKPYFLNSKEIVNFNKQLDFFSTYINEEQKINFSEFNNEPHLTFLGTVSARPNLYRNVSSILINFKNKERFILLDCGEGTFNQIYDHFGPQYTDNILSRISLIFISHQHGDHYLGILKIIYEIQNNQNLRPNKDRVWIIAPVIIYSWINKIYVNDPIFQNLFELIKCEDINPNINQIYANNDFKEIKQKSDEEIQSIISVFRKNVVLKDKTICKFYDFINNLLGINFYAIEVYHCEQSYGCVLNDYEEKSWKLSYSGDCRPCINFINFSKNSTLTIHEATFNKDSERAKATNHSTISEAIKVAEMNNSWRTILTHFSGKKLIIPYSQKYESNKILFANDYLSLGLKDLEKAYIHSKNFNILLNKFISLYPKEL